MKGFSDMFVGIIVNDFNKYLNNRTFSESFKLSEFIPVYKRYEPDDKITIDRQVFFQIFPKFMKYICMMN